MEKPKIQKSSGFFETTYSIEELISQQGVKPISNLKELVADFWPHDETVDDFLNTLRQWRSEGTQ